MKSLPNELDQVTIQMDYRTALAQNASKESTKYPWTFWKIQTFHAPKVLCTMRITLTETSRKEVFFCLVFVAWRHATRHVHKRVVASWFINWTHFFWSFCLGSSRGASRRRSQNICFIKWTKHARESSVARRLATRHAVWLLTFLDSTIEKSSSRGASRPSFCFVARRPEAPRDETCFKDFLFSWGV